MEAVAHEDPGCAAHRVKLRQRALRVAQGLAALPLEVFHEGEPPEQPPEGRRRVERVAVAVGAALRAAERAAPQACLYVPAPGAVVGRHGQRSALFPEACGVAAYSAEAAFAGASGPGACYAGFQSLARRCREPPADAHLFGHAPLRVDVHVGGGDPAQRASGHPRDEGVEGVGRRVEESGLAAGVVAEKQGHVAAGAQIQRAWLRACQAHAAYLQSFESHIWLERPSGAVYCMFPAPGPRSLRKNRYFCAKKTWKTI